MVTPTPENYAELKILARPFKPMDLLPTSYPDLLDT